MGRRKPDITPPKVNVSVLPVVTNNHHSTLKPSLDVSHERTPSVNRTVSAPPVTQPALKSNEDSQIERKLLNKAGKNAQPFKAVPAPKNSTSAKKILTTGDDLVVKRNTNDFVKKNTSEDSERCRKPRVVVTNNKTPGLVGEENGEQGKDLLV